MVFVDKFELERHESDVNRGDIEEMECDIITVLSALDIKEDISLKIHAKSYEHSEAKIPTMDFTIEGAERYVVTISMVRCFRYFTTFSDNKRMAGFVCSLGSPLVIRRLKAIVLEVAKQN